ALLHPDRHRAHCCPANSEEVKPLRRFFHAPSLRCPCRKENHGLHGWLTKRIRINACYPSNPCVFISSGTLPPLPTLRPVELVRIQEPAASTSWRGDRRDKIPRTGRRGFSRLYTRVHEISPTPLRM